MKNKTFRPRIFLGIDFTPRKRYRAEVERLERMNGDVRRSFADVEKSCNDFMKKCAEERNLRLAAENELKKFRRKRGAKGRFVKMG